MNKGRKNAKKQGRPGGRTGGGPVRKRNRYKSPDDLHTYFVKEENTEYLLCDACAAAGEGGDDEVVLIRPSAELTAASMSRWMVSEEGYAHACQGHDHLVCEHVLLRLWVGAIPYLTPATP